MEVSSTAHRRHPPQKGHTVENTADTERNSGERAEALENLRKTAELCVRPYAPLPGPDAPENELADACIRTAGEAAAAYYSGAAFMPDFAFDAFQSALAAYCAAAGINTEGLSGIGTVGAPVKGASSAHAVPALSLGKTKSREELKKWLGGRTGCLSWKLDGMTLVVTYRGGKLFSCVTRGDGFAGTDVTEKASHFAGIPASVPVGSLTVRGEALVPRGIFSEINASLPAGTEPFSNERSLIAGTLNGGTACPPEKCVFRAFTAVQSGGSLPDSYSARLDLLGTYGFMPVEHRTVRAEDIDAETERFSGETASYGFATDGLVLFYDDAVYGESLGNTSQHPRGGIAFKWQDEVTETEVLGVRWTVGRTGAVTPAVIFRTVVIGGSEISKASVHNPAVLSGLRIGKGDTVGVYRANMIIPQIAYCVQRTGTLSGHPSVCPSCGRPLKYTENGHTASLFCTNPECPARSGAVYSAFCARDALEIKGLAGTQILKLISAGVLKHPEDLLKLGQMKESVAAVPGFGAKTAENLAAAAENARRNVRFPRFLTALCIPAVGRRTAELLSDACGGDPEKFLGLSESSLAAAAGPAAASAVKKWLDSDEGMRLYTSAAALVTFAAPQTVHAPAEGLPLSGRGFAVHGTPDTFSGQKDTEAYIVSHGGTVQSGVSGKTYALVCAADQRTGSKAEKAAAKGVRMMTGAELRGLCGETP